MKANQLSHFVLLGTGIIMFGCTSADRSLSIKTDNDFQVYQLAIGTADDDVVVSSIRAIAKYGEGYQITLSFIRNNYHKNSGLFAAKQLMSYAARPDYLKDLSTLLEEIDYKKVGAGEQLKNAILIRSIIISQLFISNPKKYGNDYIDAIPSILKASNYRIGFQDTIMSDNLELCTRHGLLSNAAIIQLFPHFMKCLKEAFHSSEIEESVRCLEKLTGVIVSDRKVIFDKIQTEKLFSDWFKGKDKLQ